MLQPLANGDIGNLWRLQHLKGDHVLVSGILNVVGRSCGNVGDVTSGGSQI